MISNHSTASPSSKQAPSSIKAQRRLLAQCLVEGAVPAEAAGLTTEMFEHSEGTLWESLQTLPEISIGSLLKKCHLLTYGGWNKASLLALKKSYKVTSTKGLVNAIRRAWACEEMLEQAKIMAKNAEMGIAMIDLKRLQEIDAGASPTSKDNSFKTITTTDLFAMDCSVTFFIEDILVAAQPMVMGALSKSMKTSIMLDMAISLATATPFLGKFAVPAKVKSMIFTGESGAATIKSSAMAIAQARGLKASDIDVRWSFQVPLISDVKQVSLLRTEIEKHAVQVLFIDPTYLALADEKMSTQAGNIFNFGRLLAGITKCCQELGVTLVLLHHFKKTGEIDKDDPCSLDRLSQAGFGEWARQWLLLARSKKYEFDGVHELRMKSGGSAGHGDEYYLTINEGKPKGTTWETSVTTKAAHDKAVAEEAADKKESDEHAKLLTAQSQLQLALADGEKTLNTLIGICLPANKKYARAIMDKLVAKGVIATTTKKSPNGKIATYYSYVEGSKTTGDEFDA